jgi:uncharacterized RDD family membrane protein YckC
MEPQKDLLEEFNPQLDLYPVGAGVRFLDYLIDLVIYYILSVGIMGVLLVLTGNRDPLFSYMIAYSLYVLYYTILEGASGGRTIGKMITGCKAIKADGSQINWRDALQRSLSRIVPFEPFSGLNGRPWHDNWTGTMVIKNK